MRRWSPLNDRQRELLRRLDAGVELGLASAERLSAYALRDRGLLTIGRRSGAVRAKVTEAGEFYLEHGHHPEDPRYAGAPQSGAKRRPVPYSERAVAARARRAKAAELIERLVAERRVVIPEPDEATEAEYLRAVDYAKRHDLTPPGKRIERLRLWNRDLQISLEDGPHHNAKSQRPESVPPISVPAQLRSLHPVVGALKEDQCRLAVSAPLRSRALRLFQGLCAEAVKRGYAVREHPMDENYRSRAYGYDGAHIPSRPSRREGELDLVVGDFTYTVTIKQEFPLSEDPERAQSLMVELPYSRSGRRGKWADRKRWRLEDVLGAVLREVEVRSREDAQRRIDEKQAEEDRQIRWQAAMDSARKQAIQAQLATVLREQAQDWHRARKLSQYCDALEDRLAVSDESADPEFVSTQQWLEWARAYVGSLDPLRELPGMPAPRDPEAEEMKPYLRGWSPRGSEEQDRSWGR
ncbi:hypothetical protein [Streptomyces sp. NBC_00503]|uniref:hypothetical protein n=1 Tax=Streptomyces sp. NBC_00503 TaxID=2903659 RepID=UPI002E820432|nr:hypothetical protein [Streptomyces sp. NBC_00503]WUD84088.1 hypothetical protein OG490_28010 [Streptomyces sp. NBC_00503]